MMTRRFLRMMVTILVTLVVPPARGAAPADGWTRFRGPNGSGVDTAANPPATFTDKDILWKTDLPGTGHCSPVVVGKKIFITAGDPASGLRHVFAIDLDSGKQLWHRQYESRAFKQHADNSFASASCAADDQRIVFSFVTPESYKVYCLDHAGKDLWEYDMGRWESQHGCGASPILFDGMVIAPNDQDGPTASLVALDAATGKLKWTLGRAPGATAASTPCVFQPKDGPAQIILTSTASGLVSVDPATGKVNWAIDGAFGRLRCIGSPTTNNLYCTAMAGVGGSQRQGLVVQPDPKDPKAAPKLLHKIPTGATQPYVPTPVFIGSWMFLWSDAGTVSCLEASTGKVAWQQKVGGDYYASPIVAGDKLYNVSKKGEVVCLRAADKFELLGKSDLGAKSFSTPAIVGSRMVFRTVSGLLCVGK